MCHGYSEVAGPDVVIYKLVEHVGIKYIKTAG